MMYLSIKIDVVSSVVNFKIITLGFQDWIIILHSYGFKGGNFDMLIA